MRLLNNTFETQPQLLQFFSYSFINQVQRVICTLIFLFSFFISGESQDCLNDTVPPVIICKQDFIYRTGSCGNDLVFASEFVLTAFDNCTPVSITFDKEENYRWLELGTFWCYQTGPFCEITIYARDTFGNVSECISTYKMVPKTNYDLISCELIYGFPREIDKINLKFRTNTNTVYSTVKDKYSNKLSFWATYDGLETINSLILDVFDTPFTEYRITDFDLIETLYLIIGQGRYLSPVNYKSADSDCNGEVNLIDVYRTKKYQVQIPYAEPCLGKPLLYFIDSNGNILGREIPYVEDPIELPIIAYNIIGEINRYLPDPGIAFNNPVTKYAGNPVIWNTKEINCQKGNQYAVDFTLNDSVSLFGLQCNFEFDSNLIRVDNFSTNFTYLNKNIYPTDIRLNWVNGFGPKFENDYPKATILFTAKSDFKLSDAFKPSEQSISNFAITSDGTVRPIVTSFSFVNAADHEDKDSPWIKVSTTSADPTIHIWGSIAQFDEAELFIHNIYGQTIYKQKIRTSDGQINEFIQVSNPGVYILDLKLPNRQKLVQAFMVVK